MEETLYVLENSRGLFMDKHLTWILRNSERQSHKRCKWSDKLVLFSSDQLLEMYGNGVDKRNKDTFV